MQATRTMTNSDKTIMTIIQPPIWRKNSANGVRQSFPRYPLMQVNGQSSFPCSLFVYTLCGGPLVQGRQGDTSVSFLYVPSGQIVQNTDPRPTAQGASDVHTVPSSPS